MERRRFTPEFKLEALRLIRDRGISYAQASQDLAVHQSQLRNWVKAFADDPQQAFPGQGHMKPEQLEIARRNLTIVEMDIPLLRSQDEWVHGALQQATTGNDVMACDRLEAFPDPACAA